MIIINAISGKQKRINGETQLRSFLEKYDNAKDIFLQLLSWHNKGEVVYWATNPFEAEMHKKEEIIVNLSKEEVRDRFYSLSEEV